MKLYAAKEVGWDAARSYADLYPNGTIFPVAVFDELPRQIDICMVKHGDTRVWDNKSQSDLLTSEQLADAGLTTDEDLNKVRLEWYNNAWWEFEADIHLPDGFLEPIAIQGLDYIPESFTDAVDYIKEKADEIIGHCGEVFLNTTREELYPDCVASTSIFGEIT